MKDALIAAGDPYPPGDKGDLAVGHYKQNGAAWVLEPVETKAEADARLRAVVQEKDVLRVVLESGPHQGRPSAVAWVARCNGGSDWTILEETEGMKQYEPDE